MEYWDGDFVDENGLFLGDGTPATFQDFIENYYSLPPENWASQFPEYNDYKPTPLTWNDSALISNDELIEAGGDIFDQEAKEFIDKIIDVIDIEKANILKQVKVLKRGLPTLNGYASKNSSGERCIVLHAGLEIALSKMNGFIYRLLYHNDGINDTMFRLDLTKLANFIGSYGIDGLPTEAFAPATWDSVELVDAAHTHLNTIIYRRGQLLWIIAHECAHHIFNHLEIIENDLERCNFECDLSHYNLRQELEIEADAYATEIVLKTREYTSNGLFSLVDFFLSFMSFVDSVLGIQYSTMSTHPSSYRRLLKFRKDFMDLGYKISSEAQQWENYITGIAKAHPPHGKSI